MEEPKSNHKPVPGIAEALNPEIGNGAALENEKHAFILRLPDPSIQLSEYLKQSKEELEEISNQERVSEEVNSIQTPNRKKLTTQISEEQAEDVDLSQPAAEHIPDQVIDSPPAKGSKKKKNGKSGKDVESDQLKIDEPSAEVGKPPKAGKLVRKVAKSAKKQAERQKTQEIPIIEAPQPTLSPFTSWLKNLTGSDYVHPYEDDFAVEQALGQGKEGISETFADLLAAQGYKDQAREMYLKLMEKYPEKSGFFAAKIEAL